MRKLAFAIVFTTVLCLAAPAQEKPVVLLVSTLLDGRGQVLHDTAVIVRDGKITAVGPQAAADASATLYDLRGLTVMPGWIDTHVHIGWHFDSNGRLASSKEDPRLAAFGAAANAWATLMGGFTTVQSVGDLADKPLRDFIARGLFPGPRILTSLEPLTNSKLTPDEIREFVRQRKQEGADLIKIFASKSIRDGGGPTLTEEQLRAACGEAKALGLRTLVHAYRGSSRDASLAGCTQVEHGTFATDSDLKLLAERGTYFDPQAGLVIYNYLEHKKNYLGIGNYTEAGFEQMKQAIPLDIELFKRAIATPGLKVVFGTDAVAGAHGHNADEFIYRVRDCGQDPMAAMVSANSLAAESMGLEKEIGSIVPGMQADIIAVKGDPLKDITMVRNVVFVMKGGQVYKDDVNARH